MSRRQILRGVTITSVLIITGLVALVAARTQEGRNPSGYVGAWEAIDCATDPMGTVNCSVWGDGSRRTLHISHGDTPAVLYQDEYSADCDYQGSPSTRWVAAGEGEYRGLALFVTFFKSGCGRFVEMNPPEGGEVRQFYWDAGSDTIWEDSDGDNWGYMFHRTNPVLR